MTPPVDRRNKLQSDPFDHRVRKDGGIEILRGGRIVIVIGGTRAAKLAGKLERASAEQTQLLLAKASGHYKH